MPIQRTTVRLVLRESKLRKDGTAPVYLRATANRKSRFSSTGIYLDPKHWNESAQKVRKSHPIAPALNAKLDEIKTEAQAAALDATSAADVKASLDGSVGSLTRFFERFNARLDEAGQLWEWKKYQSTLTKLQRALGSEITWRQLDRDGLAAFETYCRVACKNNANTIRKELARLRRVVRQALREGEIRPEHDPFLTYDPPKGQPVHRRKLTFEEIEKLVAADFEPGSANELARDAFVFSFYVGGMRFGDVCKLRRDELRDGRAEYRMMKTRAQVTIPVPPPATQIADRYAERAPGLLVFPLLRAFEVEDPVQMRRRISSKNAQVNASLKRVAKAAGIVADGLSFHVARHSFADYARTRSGNLYAISKTLGHGDLKTTEAYLRDFDRDAVDQLARDLWS